MKEITYMASFHNHTRYSDGDFRVEELVEKVHNMNGKFIKSKRMMIKGVAVVDHDFYPSEAAIARLRAYASRFDIDLIFGTEISSDSALVDILGYELNAGHYSLFRYVTKEHYKRLEAFQDTCRRLNRFFGREGITIDLDRDVSPKALKRDEEGKVLGYGPLRWHYLREAMVQKGMVKDTKEAKVLIGPGGPCYHQRETIDSITTVEAILGWEGKPVLAHPHKIPEAFRLRVMQSLIEAGLFGIEAFTESYAEPEASNIYVKMALENKLLILAGTDLHRNIEDVGRFLLPYEIFLRLKRPMPSLHVH